VGSGGKLGFTTRAAVDGEIVGPNVVGAVDGASVKGYAVSNTATFFKYPTKKSPIGSALQPR
jgi:hypothetical protein